MEELTLKKCMELAVTTEQLGAKFYRDLAAKFEDNPEVKEVFSRLAKDELIHEAQFKKLADEVNGNGGILSESDQEYLNAIVYSKYFDSATFEDAEKIDDPGQALVMAAAFEKATLLYYMVLRESLGDSPQLDAIIKAEKEHVTALTRVILSDAKFRGISDGLTF